MKICDSYGHTYTKGGADYGVVNIQDESKCIREIAPLVAKYLKEQGISVVEARIDKANSVNASMAYRVNIANTAKVDLFIEIHLNSGGGEGVETLICSRGGKAERYAKSIVNSLAELGYKNRGVRVDKEYLGYPLYVLRNTNAPAVIVECGFTDSKCDVNRYNADAIARKIVKGITGKEDIKEQLKPTHYINSKVNVPVYKEMELKNYFGALVPNEKVEYVYSNGKVSYIKFGNILDGCIESKYLTPIGTEPPKGETEKNNDTIYRVQVGAFSNKENAESYVNDLKQKGIDACIKAE